VLVEIWSDVVCPWCYIGKRRFEQALEKFEHRDEVKVIWRAFELDPGAPARREGDYAARIASKNGITREEAEHNIERMTRVAESDGLDFHFDRSQPGNTFDAHRLLHYAAERGRQDELKERLLRATFTEGEPIGDRDTLLRLAVDIGLDADDVRAVLDGDAYSAEVRADEQRANVIGITGVPFFVMDARYGVSGAQSPDVLLDVLERTWADAHPIDVVAGGEACDGDSCAV
jgi:predicted DsbA family dithiol-disulfide isomerase